MKLRQRTRAEPMDIASPAKRRLTEKVDSSGKTEYLIDDTTSFEEVSPFSPWSQQHHDRRSDQSDTDSDCDNDKNDEDWIGSPRRGEGNRPTGELAEKAPNKTVRKPSIRKPILEENFYKDIDLSDIVGDKSMLDHVKQVLNLFPNQFTKAYCRYVFEEQNKDKSETVLKKSCCKLRLFLVKDDSDKCTICGEEMKHNRRWEHLKQHEGPTGFKCICGKTFKSISLFYTHLSRIHAGVCYRCPHCNARFASAEHIEEHLKKDHNEKHRYTCAVCSKGIDKETTFLEHINSHTGLRPHQCTDCDKKYRSANDLREHRRHHKKEEHVVCHVCKKEFVSQKLLNVHALVHGKLRKYTCNICGKAYKTKQNLVNHQSFHATEKSFSCVDCDRSYTTKSALNNHFRKRQHGPHAEKNEDNEFTDDEVTSDKKLVQEKYFSCCDCSCSYSQKRALNAHFKRKKHGPHSERMINEDVDGNMAITENTVYEISGLKTEFKTEFSSTFNNTVVLSDEVRLFEFSSEINKQPLVLEKRIVVEDMENDSDEETGLFICL